MHTLYEGHIKNKYQPAKKPVPMPVSKETLWDLSQDFKTERDLSLFCFLYLSGARISEGLKLHTTDVERLGKTENNVFGIAENIKYAVVRLTTLKNRQLPYRKLPIANPNCKIEQMMLACFMNRVTASTDLVWPNYSRHHACMNFRKITFPITAYKGKELIHLDKFHLHPHYLRHCRLTHLVTEYNINTFKLQKWAGWASLKPALYYLSLNWRDLSEIY